MAKFKAPQQEFHHILAANLLQSAVVKELHTETHLGDMAECWCTLNHVEKNASERENILLNYGEALTEVFPLLADKLMCELSDGLTSLSVKATLRELERYLMGTARYSHFLAPPPRNGKTKIPPNSDSILIVTPSVFRPKYPQIMKRPHSPNEGDAMCRFTIAHRDAEGSYTGGQFYYIDYEDEN